MTTKRILIEKRQGFVLLAIIEILLILMLIFAWNYELPDAFLLGIFCVITLLIPGMIKITQYDLYPAGSGTIVTTSIPELARAFGRWDGYVYDSSVIKQALKGIDHEFARVINKYEGPDNTLVYEVEYWKKGFTREKNRK